MKKKIIFVGASTPNLYAAKKLQSLGFEVVVFERNSNHNNPSMRVLPLRLLNKLGMFLDSKDETKHVSLTEIKDFLAEGIKIIYDRNLVIDYPNEKCFLNNEELIFDYLVINTGHKTINADSKKIFTYNYSVPQHKLNNHFPGNSLESSIEAIDKIISKML